MKKKIAKVFNYFLIVVDQVNFQMLHIRSKRFLFHEIILEMKRLCFTLILLPHLGLKKLNPFKFKLDLYLNLITIRKAN